RARAARPGPGAGRRRRLFPDRDGRRARGVRRRGDGLGARAGPDAGARGRARAAHAPAGLDLRRRRASGPGAPGRRAAGPGAGRIAAPHGARARGAGRAERRALVDEGPAPAARGREGTTVPSESQERPTVAAEAPTTLYLEVTNRCNSLCTHCPRTYF